MIRAFTKDEYEKLDYSKPIEDLYELRHTRVPPTIAKIHRQHAESSAKILKWISSIGCDLSVYIYDKDYNSLVEHMLRKTSFEIKVRHENDYIECGPGIDDEEGKRFLIFTTFETNAVFDPENLQAVSQRLELFADNKLEANRAMPNVGLDFYSWTRDLRLGDMYDSPRYPMKLRYKLKFKIYHIW